MDLGRARRRTERGDEATASAVVVEPVQDATGELALSDEHAVDRERERPLVERSGIRPRAAVDVVRQRVPVGVEVLEPLELADSFVSEAGDRDRLDLARP